MYMRPSVDIHTEINTKYPLFQTPICYSLIDLVHIVIDVSTDKKLCVRVWIFPFLVLFILASMVSLILKAMSVEKKWETEQIG